MPANFSGTWVTAKSEGWGALLEAMKVDKSKMPPADLKMTEVITQKGNDITIVTSTNLDPSAKKESKIAVGGKFTDTTFGVTTEFTTAWEGDKLVFTATDGTGGGSREIIGSQLVDTFQYKGLAAKTWYDKQ